MTGKTFVDTNVLIYAHDLDAGPRRQRAAERLAELWIGGRPSGVTHKV
jgi:predicted nucleic acid-binding protein